jgi:2-phospho-L-lactate guanylyltransferase (CobY/MobA/RfbA family)
VTPFTALVLAGERPGAPDPAAVYAAVAHKALIEVQGRPLLARVVGALRQAGAERIAVSTSKAEVIALAKSLDVDVIPASASPSLSVAQGVAALRFPVLVTTADHALLQAEWVRQFLDAAPLDVDIAALMGAQAVVAAAAPQTQRTYLRFADGRYSACNLFLLRTPEALKAIGLWRRVEAERKTPWRIAARLGVGTLLAYALGMLTLDGAVARLGRRAGVRAAVVRTPFGLAAVDVDKAADLDLVRRIVGDA